MKCTNEKCQSDNLRITRNEVLMSTMEIRTWWRCHDCGELLSHVQKFKFVGAARLERDDTD